MASLDIEVKMTFKVEEVEADGSECYICGDACFLNQFEASVFIDCNGVFSTAWSEIFCLSCEPCVRETFEEIGVDS